MQGFDSWKGDEICLFSTVSKSAQEYSLSGLGMKLTTYHGLTHNFNNAN
jgi:hypothetical protein